MNANWQQSPLTDAVKRHIARRQHWAAAEQGVDVEAWSLRFLLERLLRIAGVVTTWTL